MNVRNALRISNETESEYRSQNKKVQWTDVYASEAEIIADLKKVHIPTQSELLRIQNCYKGYEYIHSFAKRVQDGKELTDKQMVQCKRMALEIKKAARIACCFQN